MNVLLDAGMGLDWHIGFQRIARMASIPVLLAWLLLALPVQAASLLRDADMEHALKQLAAPVLRAAGLSSNRVKILVVNDGSLNAFVINNTAIFIHRGLITKLESAEALQAVIAHEAAHIANGHIVQRISAAQNARGITGFGLALALAAAASGNGQVSSLLALGVSSSAQRGFLSHTRAQEASADQAAIRYMKAAGVNPEGMAEVLGIFAGQEVLSAARQDPYTRSHPLSRDRMRAVNAYIASYGTLPANGTAAYWFARAKGKLTAYTRNPKWTLRRLKSEPYADIRLLREAIARHRNSDTKRALKAINAAIAARPKDPFLRDQKGQILLETRNFKAAVAAYGNGVNLAPRDPLLLSGYGRALLATGQVKKALQALEKSRRSDWRDGSMLRDLAVAYAKNNQPGMAALTTAERYALGGRLKDAGIHANRALGLLARGSGPWQRAQDVQIAAKRAARKR